MISISIGFRRTRAKDKNRPGIVYFRLYGPKPDGSRFSKMTNTNITGTDEAVLISRREEIISHIRIIYQFISSYTHKMKSFSILNVVEEYRRTIKDKNRLQRVLKSIDQNSVIRADIFSVGSGFHKYIKTIYLEPEVSDSDFTDVLNYISVKSQSCKAENKISTSRSYLALKRVLMSFWKSDSIPWDMVDKSFVKNFAEWLDRKELKESTRGYYMSMLRTLLFKATEHGLCSANSGWFKKVITVAMPTTDDRPSSSVDIDTIRRINSLDLRNNENLSMVRDMYMFAFFSRGMELFDVAHLTSGNIHGDVLVYNKRLTGKEVKVPIEKDALTILNRYDKGNSYIFPLLEKGKSDLFPSKRNWVNNNLKLIGKIVGTDRLTFVTNIEAWSSMFSNMHITENLFTAT